MLRIEPRYCGPPESGNGGYSAGLLGTRMGGCVEVTLRVPPPLACALSVVELPELLELRAGEELIAEARPARLDLEVPSCPSFERARQLSELYVGHKTHNFPSCFVCGPGRAAGDGLRIFPGSETPQEPVAAPFVPDASLADAKGLVRPEILWAALDCSGYFACAAPTYPIALLGRITAELFGVVRAHERCVVMGWALGREGRKLFAGTALFGQDGELRGLARQVWIQPGGPNSSRVFRTARPSQPPPAPSSQS
jgi:hypothetical protein